MVLGTYDLSVLAFGAIAFGLFLLIKGGDWTIDAASYIAEKAGLSKLFIGATIVAFGTSVPELFTSVNANLSGFPGLSLGNVVGSNIANILLVIGATAIIFTIKGQPKELFKDLAMMTLATILLVLLMLNGIIPRWAGAGLFLTLVAYVIYQYRTDKGSLVDGDADLSEEEDEKGIDSMAKAVGFVLLGLFALVIGSEMLVRGAVAAGTAIGVPEAVIGLTVVALGTSLPELSTCIAAALKRQTNMIIGNILGSNVFNVMSILGITAMTKPLIIDPAVADFDMWVMAAVGIGFVLWMVTVSKIGRGMGIAMVLAYVAFTFFQFQPAIAG